VEASGDRSACGRTDAKKVIGWATLWPSNPELGATVLSTAELLGLAPPSISIAGRATPAVVAPTLVVNEALFSKGVALRHADKDEVWVSVKPAKAPVALPAPLRPLMPQPGALSAREPAAFAEAQALAGKAAAIDARVAGSRRDAALTHGASGFEVRLLVFFDGATIVKVLAELAHPYAPPMAHKAYWFERERLLARQSILHGFDEKTGDPTLEATTTFYDDKGELWSDRPTFDPKKRVSMDTAVLAREIKKALRDPAHRVADDTL
jgi:hypothetical protein